MSKEDFVGAWHLIAAEFRRADGEVTYPYGQEVTGLLIYTAEGYMTAQLMRTDRPPFASGDRRLSTPEEIQAAFNGFAAYFGTYTVDESAGTVTHTIHGDLVPNEVGTRQTRTFTFSGTRLVLSALLRRGGVPLTARLIWERAR